MKKLRVLIGCESSGAVRDAFTALGHDAMSCDLLETEVPGQHYKGDLRDVIHANWDLAIFHPPCTHLSVSGAAWHEAKRLDGRQQSALSFVGELMKCDIEYWALENPVSVISSVFREADQTIQPHEYGHPEFKSTCFWLKNLPLLQPTNRLEVPEKGTETYKEWEVVHRMPPGEDRWKERSRTYSGIAAAMADQWSRHVLRQGDLFWGAA